MKIHFQSTADELKLLQTTIPQAVMAYEAMATTAGMTPEQIGKMQTVDNTPSGGGHCGFDGKAYTTGVQLMANNYNKIMAKNATGMVTGVGNVLKVSPFFDMCGFGLLNTNEFSDRSWQREAEVYRWEEMSHS